jgi:hypothetical protein
VFGRRVILYAQGCDVEVQSRSLSCDEQDVRPFMTYAVSVAKLLVNIGALEREIANEELSALDQL